MINTWWVIGGSMAGWLILLVAVIYFIAAIQLFLKGSTALAIVFVCYAFSNIALYTIS